MPDETTDEAPEAVKGLWGTIRAAFPPNRAVAVLTPFVATISAAIFTWLVNELPFVADSINEDAILGIFVSIVVAVVAMAYKWLDGWTKYEQDTRVGSVVGEIEAGGNWDDDTELSLPGDIVEDDFDLPEDDPALASDPEVLPDEAEPTREGSEPEGGALGPEPHKRRA